eukprot:11228294-Lingulodinium_polyedra.AAC.2
MAHAPRGALRRGEAGSVFQTLRNGVVERAVRRFRAAQCVSHARAMFAPKIGASMARVCVAYDSRLIG